MAIRFDQYPELKLTIFRWEGIVTANQWLDVHQSYMKNPSRFEVHDFLNADGSGFDYQGFQSLIHRINAVTIDNPSTKCKSVFVTGNLIDFNLGQTFSMLADVHGISRKYLTVNTMAEAFAALGISPPEGIGI
ncbi:MAG: hypothetical protein ABIL58_27400 [Pseudomonadota bacterium]